MTNKARKNNQSLWQKSMKLVGNIAKVPPAISIAEKSVGTKPARSQPPTTTTVSIPVMDAASITFPYIPESRRSQEPKRGSVITSSYLMELPEEIHVIREEEANVDGRASDYIKRFREKLGNDHSVPASKLSPIQIMSPPLPRGVK